MMEVVQSNQPATRGLAVPWGMMSSDGVAGPIAMGAEVLLVSFSAEKLGLLGPGKAGWLGTQAG